MITNTNATAQATCSCSANPRVAGDTSKLPSAAPLWDFAEQMRWLVDEAYPDVGTIRLVLDNLNTHKLGSLYEAFDPTEVRRIARRLELHHTPKHGSWLNMAEIELSVFSRQCLKRRIGDEKTLRRQIEALEHERNEAGATVHWRFTTQDARIKLRHIYPTQLH